MSKSSVIIAATVALIVGVGSLVAGTAPAQADGAYFGFSVGGYDGPRVGFGYHGGGYYGGGNYYGGGGYYPPPAYRPYRRAPVYGGPVEVCEDVWRTRRVRDQWGRVVKVVKVRDRVCGPTWR
jgi:hypothetical protein